MLSKAAVPAAAIKYMEDLEVEGETEAYFTTHLEYFYRFVPRNIPGFLLGKYIPFFSHAWNFQLGPLALDLGFMAAQFNLSLGINAMSLLGVLFMLYVYLVQ